MPAFRSFVPDPSGLGEKFLHHFKAALRPGNDTTVTEAPASPSRQGMDLTHPHLSTVAGHF